MPRACIMPFWGAVGIFSLSFGESIFLTKNQDDWKGIKEMEKSRIYSAVLRDTRWGYLLTLWLGIPPSFGGDVTEVQEGLVTCRGRDWSERVAWDLRGNLHPCCHVSRYGFHLKHSWSVQLRTRCGLTSGCETQLSITWDRMVMVLPLHWEEEGPSLSYGRGRTITMMMLPVCAWSTAAGGVIGVFVRAREGREATLCIPFLYTPLACQSSVV